MKVLVVLASVIAVGLCAGGWSYVKDPSAQEWCDRLVALDTQYNLISLPDGCPQIISVQQQVVAGMNYRYIYQKDGRTCMLEYNEVLWLNERTIRADNCSIAVQRHARQTCLPGGYCDQDPSAQQYMDILTNFTAMGLLKSTADNGYTIQSVQTQVVSGVNYKYTLVDGKGHTCTLILYVQSWTQTHQVSHDECHLTMHKRQLLGGYHPCSADAMDGLKSCTGAMLDQINMQSNSMFRMVESGVNAQCKVVQGMEYKIELTAVPSTCNNGQESMGYTSTDCPVDQNSNMAGTTWSSICWYKAWEPSTKISSLHMVH